MDGLTAIRQILRAGGPRVVILTTFDLDEYVYAALRAGASGFLVKDIPDDQLVAGIRAVVRGDTLLAPTVTRRLIDAYTRRSPATGTASRPSCGPTRTRCCESRPPERPSGLHQMQRIASS
jgi:DNA-binding NarL/FixJ family response regulator